MYRTTFKKFLSLICICCIMFTTISLVGCERSTYISRMSVDTSNKTSYGMRYSYFNGTKVYRLDVPEGDTKEVYVDIKTTSGKLDVSIIKDNKDKESVYTGNDMQTSSFMIKLKGGIDYTIILKGRKHKGSYSFSWDDR